MKKRLRKIKRLKRYFEQKKNIELLELEKAVAEKFRRLKRCREIEEQKLSAMDQFASLLQGEIDPWKLRLFESGLGFFNRTMKKAVSALEEAEKLERTRRERVLKASITHRVWENLYGRNELRVRRRLDKMEELEADELALMRR